MIGCWEAAPPNSKAGSGGAGEQARGGGEEIQVGVETQHLLTAVTDKLQRIQSIWAC